jgi:hypothetical protein
MQNIEDSEVGASPKQHFVEPQLGAEVTPPSERAKLQRSFERFCEEIDGQVAAPPETVVAKETPPPAEPVTRIALQPAQPTQPDDPLDAEAKRLEVEAYIKRNQDYRKERLATRRAYEQCLQEMAQYFDQPQDWVKSQFLEPLLKDFTPAQLTAEWFKEQVGAMKAPEVIKRKIESTWDDVMRLQDQENKKAEELANRYDADQRQRSAQNWEALIMAEATTLLDDDREFLALKAIRDRARKGDQDAIAQFNDLEHRVFRPAMDKIMAEHPGTAPGAATRRALKQVLSALQSKGRNQSASPSSQQSSYSPSSKKVLSKNPRESVQEAFDEWTPPPKEDTYWDSVTSSYKRRER